MIPRTIRFRPLSYCDHLAERSTDNLLGVVIHCTELPDLAMAREYGEVVHYTGSGTGNSGHYYIDRNGDTECWVPPHRVAHHTRGHNPHTLGIELVNRGRYPDWTHSQSQALTEDYPEAQITALCGLLERLCDEFSGLTWMAGHEDLDLDEVPASDQPGLLVRRKRDPGPGFPWNTVTSRVRLQRRSTP